MAFGNPLADRPTWSRLVVQTALDKQTTPVAPIPQGLYTIARSATNCPFSSLWHIHPTYGRLADLEQAHRPDNSRQADHSCHTWCIPQGLCTIVISATHCPSSPL